MIGVLRWRAGASRPGSDGSRWGRAQGFHGRCDVKRLTRKRPYGQVPTWEAVAFEMETSLDGMGEFMKANVLPLTLAVTGVFLLIFGQVYAETLRDDSVVLRGSVGVGGSFGSSFDLSISFTAQYPVNLTVYTWPHSTPNTPENPQTVVLLHREAVTQENVVVPIPEGVIWDVTIVNEGRDPNPLDLTVRKRDPFVNASLTYGGFVLFGGAAVLAALTWRRHAAEP